MVGYQCLRHPDYRLRLVPKEACRLDLVGQNLWIRLGEVMSDLVLPE
jgi:hypothetical protein